ncbi:lipid II:glycine glycyltransferase (peptidoglycan interpeptide bridge formation enzyme) [Anaerobacterium chartisolvens]|uniref:Lipid II:glycine glycyltransferase (Peptidoglycan interpeptide bridge formation enzyme) n=1 Tax=Anaerobacterium chartisolvens TaxID=1297424 RepID=A0A369B6W1_9FIRM|nr:peptidoglycan bridge formation glycyltransferase FemA/FemB family protein [Anaerobacterium chartisolvens]RCX17243.1 lipid II:glycine glycyltransferase (peptidoglycan interpeptide bridge formation enzyme) [Anaerobacterium chartisolvens]
MVRKVQKKKSGIRMFVNLEVTANTDIEEYKSFIMSHHKGHFMQSPEWAAVKSNWANRILTVRDDSGNIKGSMSVLIRKIPFMKYTLMYSPRGPVCDTHDFKTLKALLDSAKQLSREYKSYVLRLDPDIEKSDEEFQSIIKSLNFRTKNEALNFEGIQPRFVFRLKLLGRTEDELLKSFHHKTRYNISLAIRKGVTVRIGKREDIPEFHKIMLETGIRDKFVIRSAEYFEKMYDCLGPEHLRLYLAYYDDKMVSGAVAIFYGDKCWYLYGASSSQYRNVMPNYLLQWEMIKWARENNCSIYDFRGVSGNLEESNPLYGLYKFKKGFNGDFTEFVGELDYVFNPLIYTAVEKGEKLFREIRRKIFTLTARRSDDKNSSTKG